MSILDSNIRLTGAPKKTRSAAVAGLFYPDDPVQLRDMINGYLAQAGDDIPAPKAIIAPHAGFIYSGPIAARAYATLKSARHRLTKVIVLGPAHRVYLQGLALPGATAFQTPFGDIAIDMELVQKIQGLPQVVVMDAAHAQEHSLEVQLPFLQTVLDKFTLLPLVVGDASPDQVSEVLDRVWGGDETLIVISSDLSHYHDYASARRIDAGTSAAIQHLELEKIGPHQACGCVPMSGLLNIARRSGMRVRILDLRNSGDTAGSRDRVVGYGAYSIHMNNRYDHEQREQLLQIARQSILNGLRDNRPLHPDATQFDAALRAPCANFVTLNIDGALRGCIGTTDAVAPLVISIADNAYRAAFQDPRFKPLTSEEYQRINISISVLSKPEPLRCASDAELLDQLRPRVDGLIIERGPLRATFLPEVWEALPNPRDFLSQLKRKAGMAAGETPAHAWRYEAEHIQ
jgi:hypothetical protein